MLCYVTYFSLLLLEVLEGIPGLISHPRVRLGVCVSVMVCSGSDETFFWCQAVLFWFFCFSVKSNQPQYGWKSKWNLSYPFLRASLWFFTKKNTAASAYKDDLVIKLGWASPCSPFLLHRNEKVSNKTPSANALPFKVVVAHWDLMKRQSNHLNLQLQFFSPYPVFTLNPSTILSFLPSSPLQPFFPPWLKHFPWCFIQSYFIFSLTLNEFPIQPLPFSIAPYYVFSLFCYVSIYPSMYWSNTAIHPSVSTVKQAMDVGQL